MPDLRQAAERALRAIEEGWPFDYLDNTVAPALRVALEQEEQTPVFDCPRCGHCCPQPAAQERLYRDQAIEALRDAILLDDRNRALQRALRRLSEVEPENNTAA